MNLSAKVQRSGLTSAITQMLENATAMTHELPSDFTTLDTVLHETWQLLGRGVADRRHGFHHAAVATVDEKGRPHARIVILRAADRKLRMLRFHTDMRSGKWRQLSTNPNISLLFYDEQRRVQVKASGTASLHFGNEIAKQAWAASQKMSKVCYGVSPQPSSAIEDQWSYHLPTTEVDIAAGETNFGAVVVKVGQLEWYHLKALKQSRALFDLNENTATWLVP